MQIKLAVVLVALVGATGFYLFGATSTEQHVLRALGAVNGAAIEDDRITQGIVQLRYGLAVNNDPLHHAIASMRENLRLLDQNRELISAEVPEFDVHLRGLEEIFARKQALVIDVASMTGALANSRRAIGRVGRQLLSCIGRAGGEVRDVLEDVLTFALFEDDATRHRATSGTETLAGRRPLPAVDCDLLLGSFLAHARVILQDQPIVTQDLRELTELPSRAAIRDLVEDTWRFEQASRTSMQRFSLGLLVVVLVLAAVLYRLFDRLERSRRLIHEANESLELTVQQRTEELRRTNVRLQEDIAERERAEHERDEMEVRLRQAQKLEAVGQLAAGIAHEINTPVQFVSDSVYFVKEAAADLTRLIERYRALTQAVLDGVPSTDDAAALQGLEREVELDYVLENVPEALDRARDGLGRVATIVQSMKEFSHPGGKQKEPADLNRAIRSTIVVARNEWKHVAEVETELDPELPPVPCLLGDLNQVVLNLIVNAAHAISVLVDRGDRDRGTIRISTARDGDCVAIRVSDTGCGIPPDIRDKIFDPFFTTKEVGKGTGQGLSLAHTVVVAQHGGSIDVESQVGHGTTFTIRLPLWASTASAEPEPAALAP
jgi:signal transduction histidine kinase